MGYCNSVTAIKFEICTEKKAAAFQAAMVKVGNMVDHPRNLEELLGAFCYVPENDDQGVTASSYLDFLGEDGSMWRWEFNGSELKEKQANIIWEET